MRYFTAVIILFSLTAAQIQAGPLQKAYFAATEEGSWAKYESSWKLPDGTVGTNVYTYIRAADSADRVRIEIDTETLVGPGEGMVTRQLFIMEPGFDLATNYLNRMMFLEANVSQVDDGPASLMQDNVIQIIRQSAGDWTNSVTFKGHETREGVECDLFAYSYSSGGPHVTVQEGDLCLSQSVPFGIVFQNGRVLDTEGNLASSFDQKLLESGSDRPATEALLAMSPEAAPTAPDAVPLLPFMEAYQSGKIRLEVEVLEGSGGRRLNVVVVNNTKEPFDLVIPSGFLEIPADSPLGALNVFVDVEQRFFLAPGGLSPAISAGQPGDRGATAGKFTLVVYEGQALYQGSVTVGPLE
jgi:hypothetical protein